MRKQSLLFLTLFLLAINCSAQTSLTVDYNVAAATINSTLNFNTDTIRIINVPANLASPIMINDAGVTNFSISGSQLAGSYQSAYANNPLTIKISNGKIAAPFPSSNVQAPLAISFN